MIETDDLLVKCPRCGAWPMAVGSHRSTFSDRERKANLAWLLARRLDGITVAPFERGEIGPDLFRAACRMGLRGWSRSIASGHTGLGVRSTGSR